jgi:hypothetical protein
MISGRDWPVKSAKQEAIQLGENADSDLGGAGASQIRAFCERWILPGR